MKRRAHKAFFNRLAPPFDVHAAREFIDWMLQQKMAPPVPQDLPVHISIRNMRTGGVQTFEEAAEEMRKVLDS